MGVAPQNKEKPSPTADKRRKKRLVEDFFILVSIGDPVGVQRCLSQDPAIINEKPPTILPEYYPMGPEGVSIPAIHMAVSRGHHSVVQLLLSFSPSLYSSLIELHAGHEYIIGFSRCLIQTLVVSCKNAEILKLLITAKADVNCHDPVPHHTSGSPPLILAVAFCPSLIKPLLLEYNADPFLASAVTGLRFFETALSRSYEGLPELIPYLTKQGLDVNALTNLNGVQETYLSFAVRQGQLSLAKQLLKCGADPNTWSGNDSPLIVAINQSNEAAVSLLLAKKANPSFTVPPAAPPIHLACSYYYMSANIVRSLLVAKADPNVVHNGRTPLYAGISNYNIESVLMAFLENSESPIDLSGNISNTPPLSWAINQGWIDATNAIIKADLVDINLPVSSNMQTPVHQVVFKSLLPTLELLIQKGANINAQDSSLNTPLHCACITHSVGAVSLLLANGALTTIKNAEGKTPLETALGTACEQEIHSFLKKGIV